MGPLDNPSPRKPCADATAGERPEKNHIQHPPPLRYPPPIWADHRPRESLIASPEPRPVGATRRFFDRVDDWRGDIRGRALLVILGGLICQLALGAGYIFGPLLKEITADLGATRSAVALGRAPALIVQALASPLVGFLCVRFGPRAVLGGSVLLFSIGLSSISAIDAIWQYYALNLLVGASLAGLGDITVGAVITQWVRKGRGLALGMAFTGSNLAGAILAPLVVVVSARFDWRTSVLAIGLGGLVLLLPFAVGAVRSPRPGEVLFDGDPDAEVQALGEQGSDDDLSLRQAARTRSFWLLAFSLAAFFAYFVAVIEHLVAFLTDEGLPATQAAGYFGAGILVGGLSKVGFGFVADLLNERTSLLLDYGLLALSSLLLLTLPSDTWIYPFLVLYGISTAARDVVYPLILNYCFGPRHMPQIYGVLMLALPAGSLGSFYAARTFDRVGSYSPALETFAVLNLVVFASLFLIRREMTTAPEAMRH